MSKLLSNLVTQSKIQDTQVPSSEYLSKVENGQSLIDKEIETVKKTIDELKEKISALKKEQLTLGRALYYNEMINQGITISKVKDFIIEDDIAIKKAEDFTKANMLSVDYMFGYPANISKDSPLVNYFRYLETNLSLINNCGDSYQAGNSHLNCKYEYEQPILEKLYEHFGFTQSKTGKKPWGYITPGGSESNRWGITNGLRKYPNGRVYYSVAAHYSVKKTVELTPVSDLDKINFIKHTEIPTETANEKINVDILMKEIEKNWDENQEAPILLLTWGTTKTGAKDDIVKIAETLNKKGIPHYIHLDAALIGGIGKNQSNAPIMPDNIAELGVESISVSLHKYFGSHEVKSVLIAQEGPLSSIIDYIGVKDSTTAGSRDFSPFSTMQRVIETLERKFPKEYERNISFFENQLNKNHISFSKEPKSNIFVINKPSDLFCDKYQLAVFKDKNNEEKAHIIIFPHHKESIMEIFVKELVNDIDR